MNDLENTAILVTWLSANWNLQHWLCSGPINDGKKGKNGHWAALALNSDQEAPTHNTHGSLETGRETEGGEFDSTPEAAPCEW